MIKTLSIRNYGIIRTHEIEFGTGLHVITGETGAGKSLVLGALGHLMGERYDGHPALDPEQKCVIEAEFVNEHPDLQEWLSEQGIENTNPLILRRELSQPSRTRCFIQDSPASLSQLRDISYWLIDICGQHEARELKSARIHLEYLDEFASCRDLALHYKKTHKEWQRIDRELRELEERTSQAAHDRELNQFYLEEIQSMEIKGPGELIELESQQRLIEQAKTIQESLQQAIWELDGNEQGLISRVSMLQKQIRPFHDLSQVAQDIYESYEQALTALKEAEMQAGRWSDSFSYNNHNAQPLLERIDKLNQLLVKHQTRNLAELLDKMKEMELLSEVSVQNLQLLEQLRSQSAQAHEEAINAAELLHQKRTESASRLELAMQNLMPSAGFARAQFEVRLHRNSELLADTSGYSQVEFKFSANPGQTTAPLQKVASGGELSRLTLCLRTACRTHDDISVIVFDEIDTGISGQTALGIGKLLKEMAESQQQIILITHLPQIAAAANRHFRVKKTSTELQTVSQIDNLDADERVCVLARMMAGTEAGDPARRQAEALIQLYQT